MLCTGPSPFYKELAPKIAPGLYQVIKIAIKNGNTNYFFLFAVDRALNGLGLDLSSLDESRLKYGIFGFLVAKLPNMKICGADGQWEGVAINPKNFNFSEEEFTEDLSDLLYNFDAEDF